MAIEIGIATSSTAGNGRRRMPIATKTATMTNSAITSRRLNSGVIIRNTTASIKPIAAQATPDRTRRRASISP